MKKTVSRKDYINLLANSPFTKKVFDGLYNEPIKPRVLSDYEEAVIAGFKGNKDRYNKIYGVEDIKTEVKEVKSSYVDDTSKIKEIKSAVDGIYDSIKKELGVFRNNDSTLFLETKVIKKDLNSQKELNNKRINDTNEKIEKVKAKIAEDITNASNSLKNDIDSLSAFSNTALDKIDSLTTSFANENIKLSDKFTNLLNGKSDATHTHKVDEIQGLDINVFHTKEEAKKLEKKLSDFYTKKEIKDKLMSIANSSGRGDSNVARGGDAGQVLIKRSPIDYDTYRGTAGGGTRGSITGTLSDQTDLQSALDAKFTLPSLTSGSILFSDGSTISQDNSSLFFDNTNNRLGLLTTAPTHTVTMGSTGTGIALYNTADQTTNFEFGGVKWQGNVLFFGAGRGGSGGVRSASLQSSSGNFDGTSGNNTRLTVTQGTGVNFNFNSSSTGNITEYIKTPSTFTASSVVTSILSLSPVINMTNTAGYTILLINPTETATGSGTKLLQDRQVGGSSKAVMTNQGYLGLGVTNPTNVLEVGAVASSNAMSINSGVAGTGSIYFYDGGNDGAIQYNHNTRALNVNVAGTANVLTISSAGLTSLTSLTVSGQARFTGGISTASSNSDGTFYNAHGTSGANLSVAQYQIAGGTGTCIRTGFYGKNTPTPTAGYDYGAVFVSNAPVAKASSGTHNIFANLVVKSIGTVTGTASLTNTASLYIEGASTAGTNNYGLWVDNGDTRLDGGLTVQGTISGRIVPRVTTITSSATPTINTDNCDAVTITALATDITSMTTNLTGTPNNFDKLTFRIKDDGTARAITRGASFENMGGTLPTATTISKVHTIELIYNTVTSKRGCIMSVVEA